ncbi:hypothetical protein KNU72_gp04 [Staphylococcus phage Portland]|uniref:Uncharacterized protein n=1 Tax=Staphylococcus phage Portland TaxID=2650876 RepID=A0A5J6T7F4_9CAUD|nr:hypothetical protein KNU72_gp04 [Staphylococcus phage Portland]QFG06608.1 hypothetical protein CPT_Portland_004 [Staphylococcus phage Portland]
MKIKQSFNLYDLLRYIDYNRKKIQDKKILFISDSGHNFVGIDSDNDICVNFSESHNRDLTINNDLFTFDIDIDIKKHVFNLLEYYYIDSVNNTIVRETSFVVTIDDILANFDCPVESELMIIYQNKVIYKNGNVIDHE